MNFNLLYFIIAFIAIIIYTFILECITKALRTETDKKKRKAFGTLRIIWLLMFIIVVTGTSIIEQEHINKPVSEEHITKSINKEY